MLTITVILHASVPRWHMYYYIKLDWLEYL